MKMGERITRMRAIKATRDRDKNGKWHRSTYVDDFQMPLPKCNVRAIGCLPMVMVDDWYSVVMR